MPEGRGERLICLTALVALAVLVTLIVPRWQEYAGAKPFGPRPALGGTGAPSSASPARAPAAATSEREAQRPRGHSLRLTAERGDSWLLLRKDDGSGPILFTGTLARGRSVSAAGSDFWLRMGAGQNVSGEFDGRRLGDLPAGTASVMISRGEVEVVELG